MEVWGVKERETWSLQVGLMKRCLIHGRLISGNSEISFILQNLKHNTHPILINKQYR